LVWDVKAASVPALLKSRSIDLATCGEGFMELTLNNEEQELLLSILEQRHRELLKEITHTDHREFKQGLRKNERLLDSLLSRLRGAAVQALHV
jgi:hypothetical protein